MNEIQLRTTMALSDATLVSIMKDELESVCHGAHALMRKGFFTPEQYAKINGAIYGIESMITETEELQ